MAYLGAGGRIQTRINISIGKIAKIISTEHNNCVTCRNLEIRYHVNVIDCCIVTNYWLALNVVGKDPRVSIAQKYCLPVKTNYSCSKVNS